MVIDLLTNSFSLYSIIIDRITNNYYVSNNVNFITEKLTSLESLSFSNLDNEKIISELLVLQSLGYSKIKVNLLNLGIMQLLEVGELQNITILELMQVLNTFAKQNKYNQYIKVSLEISKYILYIIEYLTNEQKIITEKFFKEYAPKSN